MTKYKISYTSRFKKDAKRAEKQGKNIKLMRDIIIFLASGTPLPPKYRDHSLTGDLKDYRECHIQPDWLLIYKIVSAEKLKISSESLHKSFEMR